MSLGVAAGLPANKILELEAEVKGSLSSISTIHIDPASRYHTEREPAENLIKNVPDCEVVRLVTKGWESKYIVASDVIRGQVTASSAISLTGGASIDAKLTEERLQKLFGTTPHISVQASGGVVSLTTARSPDVLSLAVKSRFVSALHLARLHELYQAAGPNDLELRVRQLLRDQSPGAFEEARAGLRDVLQKYGLIEPDKNAFYNRMFYWESRKILDDETAAAIPQEHWRALGIISAAHELTVWE